MVKVDTGKIICPFIIVVDVSGRFGQGVKIVTIAKLTCSLAMAGKIHLYMYNSKKCNTWKAACNLQTRYTGRISIC